MKITSYVQYYLRRGWKYKVALLSIQDNLCYWQYKRKAAASMTTPLPEQMFHKMWDECELELGLI